MLVVYNTLTKKKEEFKPVVPGEVSIYVCGITPYNDPHIGNARPFVTWDVIRRFFQRLGYKVKYIQNFTDIDDKIINAANAQNLTWKDISNKYIDGYFEVMDKLHVQHADVYPRVSGTIKEIIEMVQGLVNDGYAYVVDGGDVYFSVEKFPEYGKLSGRKLEDMQAGARVQINSQKRHPMDFALWKAAKPGEPFWESPWGQGRPGWHIECSAMSLKYLGQKFDFHGGGSDLIFPHHENEIAQSQAFCHDTHSFAQYWVHNGFITINEEKMSKSLNNFFTVKDILKKYPAETLRYFLVATHYRSPLDFSAARLQEAQASLQRLKNAKACLTDLADLAQDEAINEQYIIDINNDVQQLSDNFYTAMKDDFNTALALSYMFELAKKINIYYQHVQNKDYKFDRDTVESIKAVYDDMAFILGILENYATEETENDDLTEKLMNIIINIRQNARQEKNWPLADHIRDELKAIGLIIEDTTNGVKWRKE